MQATTHLRVKKGVRLGKMEVLISRKCPVRFRPEISHRNVIANFRLNPEM